MTHQVFSKELIFAEINARSKQYRFIKNPTAISTWDILNFEELFTFVLRKQLGYQYAPLFFGITTTPTVFKMIHKSSQRLPNLT